MVMSPDEFKAQMAEYSRSDDEEYRHIDADALMCKVLAELGYKDGIRIFRAMDKWYA